MLRSPALIAGCLVLPLVAGCGNKNPEDADMAGPPDMKAEPHPDMRATEDLTTVHEDLGPAEKPKLTGLPMCTASTVSAADLYTKTVGTNCRVGMCHMNAVDAKAIIDWWVGKPALGTAAMPLVTAGDIDQSYVMYKLMGQHMNPLVRGMGVSMPRNKPRLSDEHLCNFINWIKGGAT